MGRESLITRGTCRGQIVQTIPEDFSLFVKLWASKTEEDAAQSCSMGWSGETVGWDLLKSDIVKSRLRWLKNKVWVIMCVWAPLGMQMLPLLGSFCQDIDIKMFEINF